MKDSWLLILLSVGLVFGGFQGEPEISVSIDGSQKKQQKGTQSYLVQPGQTIVLNCSVKCPEDSPDKCQALYWQKHGRNGTIIGQAKRINAQKSHGKESDGFYHMYASHKFTSSFSDYVIYVCISNVLRSNVFIDVIQAQGAENLTLATTSSTHDVGKISYPKLTVNDSKPLILRCQFNTTAPRAINMVTWKHSNVILQKSETHEMTIANTGRLHVATLIVKKPSLKSVGVYQCEINIAVGTTVVKDINVFGPPITVLKKEHSLRVSEGSELKLVCSYKAHPQTDLKVQWFKGNYSIPFTDRGPNVAVEDEETKKMKIVGKKNVLVFTDIKETDKGAYFCKVTTSYGSDYLAWHVRVKNRLAFLWPLVGIILEVVVVVIIIIIYEIRRSRRRKAKAQAHADRQYADEDCHQPQADYDADSEVRQRLARA